MPHDSDAATKDCPCAQTATYRVRAIATPLDPAIHQVAAGETLRMTASGTWTDGLIRTDPHGHDSRILALFNLWPRVPFKPVMALCGQFTAADGTAAKPFIIGRGRVWTAPADGELRFFPNCISIWKQAAKDSENFITVAIRPDPGACDCSRGIDYGDATGLHLTWRRLLHLFHYTQGVAAIAGMVVLSMAILGLMPQGQDIITAVTEDKNPRTMIFMTLSVVFLSLQAWFWPRRIIEANFGPDQEDRKLFPGLMTWVPRLLGALPYVVVIPLIFLHPPENDPAGGLWRALATLAPALGFFLFVMLRHTLLGHFKALKGDAALEFFGMTWPILGMAISFILFVSITAATAVTAQTLGPAAVVLFAVAGLIPAIAILAQVAAIFRVPAFLVLCLWWVLCSPFNDGQHTVGRRTLGVQPAMMSPEDDTRPTLDAMLTRWEQTAPKSFTLRNGQTVRPMVIIAAEGGASRAGYWTADVLNALQTRYQPDKGDFSDSVFAISSISGGSLGAVGWVKAQAVSEPQLRRLVLRDFTGGDQLSPALASSLFPSIFQRFVPFPLLPDGGEGMERGFERSWTEACSEKAICDTEGLDQPFLDLWRPAAGKPGLPADAPGRPWLPMTFVGGAIEETGRRVITGPAKFDLDDGRVFDADDFYVLSHKNIAQSTAILNGARFPWVSPPGVIHRKAGAYHVVDGGYFDATGIETARELAEWVVRKNVQGDPILPIIVAINYRDGLVEERLPSRPFANDLLGPLLGLYRARDGHEAHMLAPLRAQIQGDQDDDAALLYKYIVCPVTLRGDATHALPLDWILSSKMKDYADDQVRGTSTVEGRVVPQATSGVEIDNVVSAIKGDIKVATRQTPVGCAVIDSPRPKKTTGRKPERKSERKALRRS